MRKNIYELIVMFVLVFGFLFVMPETDVFAEGEEETGVIFMLLQKYKRLWNEKYDLKSKVNGK